MSILLFSLQVYLFAEALADGAVKMGMPSALAQSIASQTVLVSVCVCCVTAVAWTILVMPSVHISCMYWLGSSFMHYRVLGDCYVTLGNIRLNSALRSAPRVERLSTGFTPWSRVVWEHRPWALWNLPRREPGSLAESPHQDAGIENCCLLTLYKPSYKLNFCFLQSIPVEH